MRTIRKTPFALVLLSGYVLVLLAITLCAAGWYPTNRAVAQEGTVYIFPTNPPSRFGTEITYTLSGVDLSSEPFERIQEPAGQGLVDREFQLTLNGERTDSERVVLKGVVRAQQVSFVREYSVQIRCGESIDRIHERFPLPYADGVVHSQLEYPFELRVACSLDQTVIYFIGIWMGFGQDDAQEGYRIGGSISPAAWGVGGSAQPLPGGGIPWTVIGGLIAAGLGAVVIAIGLKILGATGNVTPGTAAGEGTQEYVLDGRTYHEGKQYIFDDGKEYRVENGEFVPTRVLRDGEVYTDGDGDRKIWIGGQSWYEADWKRQAATNQEYRQAHQEDWSRELERWNQEIQDEQRKRQEEETKKVAEGERIRRERIELARERIADAELAKEEKVYLDRAIRALDRITRGLEATKYIADKSIDVLAKMTGPKGKAIRRGYRAASALAGGLGEGYAGGNWGDSLVDAGGQIVGDLIEDSIINDRYKKGYKVIRAGTAKAFQDGRKAVREGFGVGQTVARASLSFIEGSAGSAGSEFKETLKGSTKYAYTIGELAVKGGYQVIRKGGDAGAVLRGAGSGVLEGVIDVTIDYGAGQVFDTLIPETGAVDGKTMTSQMDEYHKYQDTYGLEWGEEMRQSWELDMRYDEVRDEVKGKVIKGTQHVAKGKKFDDGMFI